MKATDLTMRVLGGTPVLVVDANEDSAATLTAVLRLNGFDAIAARTVPETLAALEAHSPRVVILDPKLGDADWRKLLRRMHRLVDPLAVIILTGDTTPALKRSTIEAGAAAHLLKPAEPMELVKLLHQLCSQAA